LIDQLAVSMSDTTFYFGRINFKHQLTGLHDFEQDSGDFDKIARIRQYLFDYVSSENPVYKDEDSIWRFGRCEQHEGQIIGKFGKVFPDQPMQFDDDLGDFVEAEEGDEIADVSLFVIFPEKNVIAFNRKRHIGHKQFMKSFSQGYNNYHNVPDGLIINPIKSSIEIEHLLQRASRVFSVDFDLVPTNPIRDEDMRVLDEPMRSMGAEEMRFYAETDGSLESDNEFIRSGFALSNNGYGDFKIGFEEDGENKMYDSRDKPATYETEEPDGLGGLRSRTDEIYEKANELIITEVDSESD